MPRKRKNGPLSAGMDFALEVVRSVVDERPLAPAKFTSERKPKQKAHVPESLIWDLHVKHPPDGPFPFLTKAGLKKLPSLYRDGHVDKWGRIALDEYQIAYARSQDPLLVLEAFMWAHRNKLYPPIWVLEILCSALEKYIKDGRRETIEQLLNLSGVPGGGSVFIIRAKRRRDRMLAEWICWYADLKPCSLVQAVKVVADYWDECVRKGIYQFGYRLDKSIQKEALIQYYEKRWKREFGCDEKYLDIQERLRSLTAEQKKEFVRKIERKQF
ncbi:protein of unknown function [Nitrospira defluvii]|jgi:hypothetical protein|uniref:Uncharacterized protein n=1 Tax=Nitrospira defluvii TaxID=330214 RepID=D8P8R1_9BACT|nr:protein of unknown function [Nitrospira defluvii]